jgi:hypothetical protein
VIRLDSNADLYDYLLVLASKLESTPIAPVAATLRRAARQAVALKAGLPTEFLGESLIALKQVEEIENGALKTEDRDDLIRVIRQVEFALKR